MQVKYRSRTEITAQILDSALGGVTKTKIMYRAFLSYAQLKEYLELLVANNLLSYEEKTETFRTTEKGRRFLSIYEQMAALEIPRDQEEQRVSRKR